MDPRQRRSDRGGAGGYDDRRDARGAGGPPPPPGDRATGTTRTGAVDGPRTEATSARSPPRPVRRRGATTRGRRRARTAARACRLARWIFKTSSTRCTRHSKGGPRLTRPPRESLPGARMAHPSARTADLAARTAHPPVRTPRDPPDRRVTPDSRTVHPPVRRRARLRVARSLPRPAREGAPAAWSRKRCFVRARARAR